MEDYDPNEIANLVVGVITALLVAQVLRQGSLSRYRLFLGGFAFVLAAFALSVAEESLWTETLNLLEHSSYALAASFFALGAWRLRGRR